MKCDVAYPDQQKKILHFSFSDLLGTGHTLALNLGIGTLSLLTNEDGWARLLASQHFRDSEIRVLLPLLEAYPFYCPYETLLASYDVGRQSEDTLNFYRARLFQAQQTTAQWEALMLPVRCVLSRTRTKMRQFGIEIISITETGYMLKAVTHIPRLQACDQTVRSPATVQ